MIRWVLLFSLLNTLGVDNTHLITLITVYNSRAHLGRWGVALTIIIGGRYPE